MSVLLVESGLLDVLRRQAKLRLLHRALEAFKTLHRIGKVERPCNRCQLSMPQLSQMPSCVVSSCLVIGGHAVPAPVLGKTVNAHDAGARSLVGLRLRCKIAEIRRNDNESG